MRYLLIAGLLLLPLATWAAIVTDDSTITLTIEKYAKVTVEDIVCNVAQVDGAGTFTGEGAITVEANCEWTLSCDESVELTGGYNEEGSIEANLGIDEVGTLEVEGDMSDDTHELVVEGAFDIDDPWGDYSGTTTVTLTY